MIINLDPGTCTVSDADTLTELTVVTGISDPAALGAAARDCDLGAVDDAATHVAVGIDRLRALGRAAATLDDWDDRFDAMIAYADGEGWVGDGGRTVRAHVEQRAG